MRRDIRLLVVTGLVAVGAGLSVAILVINAAGGPKTSSDREPVTVGKVSSLRTHIRSNGPACFPDLAEGDRPFCVTLVDDPPSEDRFAAFHLLLLRSTGGNAGEDGDTERCFAKWDRKQRHFEDCRGKAIDPQIMREFPLSTDGGDNDPVLVDVRQDSK